MGVPETAREGRGEMDTLQNSKDECQAERTETGEWLWWLLPQIEKDGDEGLALCC